MNKDKRIARIIEKHLGYVNGWSVTSERFTELCMETAKEINKTPKRTAQEKKI